ncbi:MAG TPA: hypothetical protein VNX21_04235, partial [Candidatus Thermoplasmatota archaeon]|nr:hypothetical protein [Candidatus Thermoplasmatota archaeon]
MASPAAPPPGGLPLADITSRMAVFGRMFSEDVGLPDPSGIATAGDLVAIVKSRVPRSTQPGDESPVFEAAAFVGEWLRTRCDARWVAEGPYEPHLQIVDASRSVVYLLPLVSVMRVATTAGYDGLAPLLEVVTSDAATPPAQGPIAALRTQPAGDADRVVAWARAARALRSGTRAALWRRCQTCARPVEDAITLAETEGTWEQHAADAAAMLASRPFACECGGPPGEVSRFLML